MNCSHCGSPNVRRSASRDHFGGLLGLFSVQKMRCRTCGRSFGVKRFGFAVPKFKRPRGWRDVERRWGMWRHKRGPFAFRVALIGLFSVVCVWLFIRAISIEPQFTP